MRRVGTDEAGREKEKVGRRFAAACGAGDHCEFAWETRIFSGPGRVDDLVLPLVVRMFRDGENRDFAPPPSERPVFVGSGPGGGFRYVGSGPGQPGFSNGPP